MDLNQFVCFEFLMHDHIFQHSCVLVTNTLYMLIYISEILVTQMLTFFYTGCLQQISCKNIIYKLENIGHSLFFVFSCSFDSHYNHTDKAKYLAFFIFTPVLNNLLFIYYSFNIVCGFCIIYGILN